MAQHFCCIASRLAGAVSVVRFDDQAESAELVSRTSVGVKPLPMVVDADRRRLWVAAGADPVQVVTVEIDARGAGRVVDSVVCPFAPTSMAVSPDGRLVAAVSYHQSLKAWAPVGADGHIDSGGWRVVGSGRQPHCVVFSPDGLFAYVSELGEDRVVGHRVERGALVPDDALGAAFPIGSGPRHIALDHSGSWLYVIEELGGRVVHFDRSADGELHRRDEMSCVDPSEGLRPGVYVPPSRKPSEDEQRARIWAADLVLDPAGRWLVASERRASTLTLQALGPDGGFGARLDHVGTEPQPRGIGLVGSRHVVAGAEKGGTASFYRVTDRLTRVARVGELGGPSWMVTFGI